MMHNLNSTNALCRSWKCYFTFFLSFVFSADFQFFAFCLLRNQNQSPQFFLFIVAEWQFYIWNVFYIYFSSSKYLNLSKINQIGTMKQLSGPAWPPNPRTINNFLSDHRLTVSSIRAPLIFRKWKLSAVCLLTKMMKYQTTHMAEHTCC